MLVWSVAISCCCFLKQDKIILYAAHPKHFFFLFLLSQLFFVRYLLVTLSVLHCQSFSGVYAYIRYAKGYLCIGSIPESIHIRVSIELVLVPILNVEEGHCRSNWQTETKEDPCHACFNSAEHAHIIAQQACLCCY